MVKKYEIFAELFSPFPLKERPIIVGGSAVEFYTRREFESLDFDVIGDYKKIKNFLLLKGFKRKGRHFFKQGIIIEVVDTSTNVRVKIMIIGKRKIRIISLEDLIVDRLNACVHWNSRRDCEQARFLFRFYKKNLDMKYLKKRAKDEKVFGEFKDVMNHQMVTEMRD